LDGLLAEKKESFSELTLLAIEAALAAGDVLRSGYGTHFDIKSKEGHHNLVTEYDLKAEKAIIDFIKKNAPPSSFLAEESGLSQGDQESLVWVIDPLDGTVNFAHKIPVFAVSIGVEQHGEMIAGVVYQPMTHELFVAQKGGGAFFNGKQIHVSAVKRLNESILATGFPYNLAENPGHCIDHFIDILRACIPIRRLGAAAIDLAYVAAGRFEGFFEVSLSPWDCAAGKLLVEEAGGRVSTWKGAPFHIRSKLSVLATNGFVHEETVALLGENG
jgi:myo-inositol-1(or 4)-monophosphatase